MAYRQLTDKQERFCQGVAAGLSLTDAYKQAYDTDKMSQQAIWNESSKLAKRDNITHRVKELRRPIVNHYENSVIRETERIRQELWRIIGDTTGEKTENRIRALDILNRMNGAYKETQAEDKDTDDIAGLDTDKLIKLVNTA